MPENKRPIWRPMTIQDVPQVSEMEAIAHPNYHEGAAMVANRLALFAQGCCLCEIEGEPVGYMISHPWVKGQPVPLDVMIDRIPDGADCLYLHDLALMPTARGSGAAQDALKHAESICVAHGLTAIAIVALPYAIGFWERVGFSAPLPNKGEVERKYGAGARYMERSVTQ